MESRYSRHRQDEELRTWGHCRELPTEALFELLRDKSYLLRMAAARELHIRGPAEACAHALKLCAEKPYRLRETGAYLLGQIPIASPAQLKKAALFLAFLVRTDTSMRARSSAVYAIGHRLSKGGISLEDVLPALEAAANDPAAEVRTATAFALGHAGHAGKTTALLELLLRDADPDTRNWAAFSVTQSLADSPAIRVGLLAMLQDKERENRWEAVTALARLKDGRVAPAVRRELEQEAVEDAMIEAAAQLDDASLLPLLESLRERFDDSDGLIRSAIKKLKRTKQLGAVSK